MWKNNDFTEIPWRNIVKTIVIYCHTFCQKFRESDVLTNNFLMRVNIYCVTMKEMQKLLSPFIFRKNYVKVMYLFITELNFNEIFLSSFTYHSVVIAKIYSHTFLTKISWNHRFLLKSWFDEVFLWCESKFFILPRCAYFTHYCILF